MVVDSSARRGAMKDSQVTLVFLGLTALGPVHESRLKKQPHRQQPIPPLGVGVVVFAGSRTETVPVPAALRGHGTTRRVQGHRANNGAE